MRPPDSRPPPSFPASLPPLSISPSASGPRIIGVGGGSGGVGKSTLVINIAVYLAQLGRRVVVVDLDPAGASLGVLMGLEPGASAPVQPDLAVPPPSVATLVPGLRIVTPGADPATTASFRPPKKAQWLTRLRDLAADYVVLDLGAGVTHLSLDLFLAADIGICVSIPEPPSIEATYGFMRALFVRRLRKTLAKERFKLGLVEQALSEETKVAAPIDLITTLRGVDASVADLAARELAKIEPRLVVCQTRVRSDLEIGPSMAALAERYLGMYVDYLGHVEYDDAVWLTVRRCRPLLIDSPTSKAARNVERVARRVLALITSPPPRPTVIPPPVSRDHITHYDALAVTRGASDEEIRRAYKRQRELYAPGSLPLTSLVHGDDLIREQARIEEAHDTLLEPIRRRGYDLSTFPDDPPASAPTRRPLPDARTAELMMLQAELSHEINSETEFTGALLRKVRESLGIELEDISAKTKVSTPYLQAIENESFTDLPALVYTRGFVQELAKSLRLDPTQVTRTYLGRMRQVLTASDRDLV